MKKQVLKISVVIGLLLFQMPLAKAHIVWSVETISEGRISVGDGTKWGVYDFEGRLIVPLHYDEIRNFKNGLAAVRLEDKWGCIDSTGTEVIPPRYEHVRSFDKNMVRVTVAPLPGWWFSGDDELIYGFGQYVLRIKQGRAESGEIKGRYGKRNSEEVCFSNSRWRRTRDYALPKMGLMDTDGRFVIAPKYDEIAAPSEGLAAVTNRGKLGFIDLSGREVIPLEYDVASEPWKTMPSFQQGRVILKRNGWYGCIDQQGKTVVPFAYDYIGQFDNGIATVRKDGAERFIDERGNDVKKVPEKEWKKDGRHSPEDEWIKRSENGRIGFIDKTGTVMVPFYYDEVTPFVKGFAQMKENGCWGLLGTRGAVLIPAKYEAVGWPAEGTVAVKNNGKWGVVDLNGNELIPCRYDGIAYRGKFLFIINEHGKYGAVDRQGNEVIPFVYEALAPTESGLLQARLNKKYGYFNERGKLIVPVQYEWPYILPD